MKSPWISVGGTMFLGLFVAYLDRSALSVGLPLISNDLHFAGSQFAIVSSILLTVFNLGYGLANVFGGVFTSRMNPKLVITVSFAVWSLAVILTGIVSSVALIIVFRVLLGIAEGVYWPQQSRIATAWFKPTQLSRANSVIQFYGQFLSLAIGFVILSSVAAAFGWRWMFIGAGVIGLAIVLPLFARVLKASPAEAGRTRAPKTAKERLSIRAFGGPRFVLIVVAYLAQGMLFWGITLWIPLAMASFGFTGTTAAIVSGIPYLTGIVLAVPMTIISDRTGARAGIATIGLVAAGVALLLLLTVQGNPVGQLIMVSLAIGIMAACFSPNIWSVIQSSVDPIAVGPAAGIVNGIGAGLGGVTAGWLVGLLLASTGSYVPGFLVLGGVAVLGAVCLGMYGRSVKRHGVGSAAAGDAPAEPVPAAAESTA